MIKGMVILGFGYFSPVSDPLDLTTWSQRRITVVSYLLELYVVYCITATACEKLCETRSQIYRPCERRAYDLNGSFIRRTDHLN